MPHKIPSPDPKDSARAFQVRISAPGCSIELDYFLCREELACRCLIIVHLEFLGGGVHLLERWNDGDRGGSRWVA